MSAGQRLAVAIHLEHGSHKVMVNGEDIADRVIAVEVKADSPTNGTVTLTLKPTQIDIIGEEMVLKVGEPEA